MAARRALQRGDVPAVWARRLFDQGPLPKILDEPNAEHDVGARPLAAWGRGKKSKVLGDSRRTN